MEEEKEKILNVPVEDILPNRFQPRLAFDEKELNELSNSIVKYGVIQPIVLRKMGDKYEIVAGERRYKATVLAGLKTIPAILKNTDDNTSAEIALLENLQRKNLTVIEEAQSFKKLLDRGFTQEEIASKLGISQSSIANKIRLLNLPKKVQDALLYSKISERHARSLLSLNDTEMQLSLLERIINERLTVKQTEDEVNKLLKKDVQNDIPEGVMKFINNNEEIVPETPAVVEIKSEPEPQKVNNNQNVEKPINPIRLENDTINPFQVQFENNIKKIDEKIQNENESFYDKVINRDIESNKSLYNEQEKTNNNEVKPVKKEVKVYIPNVISDVRDIAKKYNSPKVTIKENNLSDRYQIIIEIKKGE